MTSAHDTKKHSASKASTSSSKCKHSRSKQDEHSRVVGAKKMSNTLKNIHFMEGIRINIDCVTNLIFLFLLDSAIYNEIV